MPQIETVTFVVKNVCNVVIIPLEMPEECLVVYPVEARYNGMKMFRLDKVPFSLRNTVGFHYGICWTWSHTTSKAPCVRVALVDSDDPHASYLFKPGDRFEVKVEVVHPNVVRELEARSS